MATDPNYAAGIYSNDEDAESVDTDINHDENLPMAVEDEIEEGGRDYMLSEQEDDDNKQESQDMPCGDELSGWWKGKCVNDVIFIRLW